MHPASIPVERRGRRVKTDRIDLDMLLRTLLAWLRGEPRVCSMVRIPSVAEEDMRRPERERERLVSERIALENRIENLLCLHGVADFKPRLKKAAARLDELRCYDGTQLPPDAMDELKRMMVRHHILSDQLKEIEAARERVATAVEPDRAAQQIQMLAALFGSVWPRRPAWCARYSAARSATARRSPALSASLARHSAAAAPNASRASARTAIRGSAGCRWQLAWRWQRMQPGSTLSCWFVERTAGAKGRIRKIMAVALARKLLVALWRYVETGEVPAGARFAAA